MMSGVVLSRLSHEARRGLRMGCLGLLLAFTASAQTALPPDEGRLLGQRVASAQFTDENGKPVEVDSLAGKPLVVSPIFTTCPHTCSVITASLKEALLEVGELGTDFNVLSLSFDTSDDAEDLRRLRENVALPPRWMLATARSEELLPFLDSIGFRFISNPDGGGFTHPNLVVFLTPELRVAKYLYGVEYKAGDVRAALDVARGKRPRLGGLGPFILVAGVLGALVTSFIIVVTWGNARRRRSGQVGAPHSRG